MGRIATSFESGHATNHAATPSSTPTSRASQTLVITNALWMHTDTRSATIERAASCAERG